MNPTEIMDRWNEDADQFNQWSELDTDEKVQFAFDLGFTEGLLRKED